MIAGTDLMHIMEMTYYWVSGYNELKTDLIYFIFKITRINRLYRIHLTSDGESVLFVDCATAKTAGLFTCIATNSEGETSVETQLTVHARLGRQMQSLAPQFTVDLMDIGVSIGHPVSLKCVIKGAPEPQLKWFFTDDSRRTVALKTIPGSAWSECRRGDDCELRTESVVSAQQGTYQCLAINEHGKALSQCYVLVGELSEEPAGPPHFVRCLRDIWCPLGSYTVLEVEVGGHPLPELTWYHFDQKVVEDKSVQVHWIVYISQSRCELRISKMGIRHVGNYSVEASNVYGVVRTNASVNVGQVKENKEPPVFLQGSKLIETVKNFYGLEDLDFIEGDSAALAGKISRRKRHRMQGNSTAANDVMKSIMNAEESIHVAEFTTLEEVRGAINIRNKKICRPKFMVKPKAKKEIEEYKSLRLKTAISANPVAVVHWDKLGVHHVSHIDSGFYNCTASNSEGLVTCTSEIEVTSSDQTARKYSKKEFKSPTFIEVLPGRLKADVGDSLTVQCSVLAYPTPSVQWLRNGTVLKPQHDRYAMLFDGETSTLIFHKLTAADSGKYCCTMTNQQGEAKTAMHLDVSKNENTSLKSLDGIPPKFLEKIKDVIKAKDGDEATLIAELVEGSEPLRIRWFHNKVEINNSSAFKHVRVGNVLRLVIADVFPEDGGDYVCEAKNDYGLAKCNMRFVVSEKRTNEFLNPPLIVEAPKSLTVDPGANAQITVTLRGHPEPAIAWSRNNQPIIPNEKYQVSGRSFTFFIKTFKKQMLFFTDNTCKYELNAANYAGSATAIVELKVAEVKDLESVLPKFTLLPISVQCAMGQKAMLNCAFTGSPQPVVSWYHSGTKIISGHNGITIISTSTTSQLSILCLQENHLGEYLCTIRNAYGEDLSRSMILQEG
ncbi:unnamed protein product [Dracunculus medinensis]|uniref:Ig-like domain-containing protein n=1 Tax=Dracunculus medinensis TaxID=318479 RepID=A0A3P7QDR2_DRAME|nr:unnamed protein product [Dracunculus medinensis]